MRYSENPVLYNKTHRTDPTGYQPIYDPHKKSQQERLDKGIILVFVIFTIWFWFLPPN